MAGSGKKMLNALGKVMISAAGKVAHSLLSTEAENCVCCGGAASCTHAIYAKACYLDVDENCDSVNTRGFWVCADSDCGAGDFESGNQTIYVDGRCYQTNLSTLIPIAELPEGEVAISGGFDCRETCSHEDCGTSAGVCQCLCYSFDEDGNYCCWGKYDEDGDVAGFSWDYVAFQQKEVTRTAGTGFNGLSNCPETDCAANASCIYERNDQRVKAGSDTSYGCCMQRMIEENRSVSKYTGGFPSFACCSATNAAPGTWSDLGLTTRCGNEIVPYISTHTVTTTLPNASGPDGCYSEQVETLDIEANCESYEYQLVTETWSYASDGLNCVCQEYQKVTDYYKYTWGKVLSDSDVELCEQCEGEL